MNVCSIDFMNIVCTTVQGKLIPWHYNVSAPTSRLERMHAIVFTEGADVVHQRASAVLLIDPVVAVDQTA